MDTQAPRKQIVALGRSIVIPAGPRITTENILHPCGGSGKTVAVKTTFVDWPDGAQTVIAAGAPAVCWHGGWHSVTSCAHIAVVESAGVGEP